MVDKKVFVLVKNVEGSSVFAGVQNSKLKIYENSVKFINKEIENNG